jgi:hypothetical protein
LFCQAVGAWQHLSTDREQGRGHEQAEDKRKDKTNGAPKQCRPSQLHFSCIVQHHKNNSDRISKEWKEQPERNRRFIGDRRVNRAHEGRRRWRWSVRPGLLRSAQGCERVRCVLRYQERSIALPACGGAFEVVRTAITAPNSCFLLWHQEIFLLTTRILWRVWIDIRLVRRRYRRMQGVLWPYNALSIKDKQRQKQHKHDGSSNPDARATKQWRIWRIFLLFSRQRRIVAGLIEAGTTSKEWRLRR